MNSNTILTSIIIALKPTLPYLIPFLIIALILKLIPSSKKRRNRKSDTTSNYDKKEYPSQFETELKKFKSETPNSCAQNLFYKNRQLFSPSEFAFFKALEPHAHQKSLLIFPKVRLADIVKTDEQPYTSEYQTAFNKINSKHVDFVLCDKTTLEIKYILELDDPTHNRPDRKASDDFKNEVMKQCGYPILRFQTGKKYDFSML